LNYGFLYFSFLTISYYVVFEQLRAAVLEYWPSTPAIAATGLAGASARVFTATLVAPLELVRTNLQAHGSQIAGATVGYNGAMDVVHRVYKTNGVRGLFSGLWPTLLRDVPFSFVYWSLYEHIRSMAHESNLLRKSGSATFGINFVAGAIAGMTASIVTTPFDVVKTHMQIRATIAKSEVLLTISTGSITDVLLD